ncbi:von Willebrand factor isoform X2 [Rhineura floridana]|uniref:von Willebrand factor isoform X2 n=1 Tax=Rhineura floridana TaxID=261503 RepID=UPI002AC86194|nr:von Willebrand factor isoform X2 [Rhineura floridana]
MVGSRILLLLLALPASILGGKGFVQSFACCSLFGDHHIKTFDESLYDFAGDCSYLLAGDCQKRSFSLLGDYQNGKRNSISLYLGEYFDIRLFLDGTVTQGDKRISIPYAANGVFIETEAGYFKLSSEEHGFAVKADISRNIHITLADKHYNKTCGLCGNLNRFAEDDFMTQEGTLEENSYNFANSWAMHSEEKRCQRVTPPSYTCNISSDIADKGIIENCQLLKTSAVFSRCHHLVDPEQFIGLCEEDMCRCAQDRDCHCPVFLEYARNCAQQGVILEGWPADTACRPRCPIGLEYKECTSPCAKMCQGLNINEVCQEKCVDGCSCPEGKLLDGDLCVDSSDCPCINSGKRYPPGSSVYWDCNSCICRHGTWICSNEPCPGECSVTGQSHFKSFDNKHFTFSGICQYLFARDCGENSFSVFIETVQCADDPDAVCTRSVSVQLQEENSIIKLKHGGGISLNGQDIKIPFMQGALRIHHTVMSSVRLSYKENMQIDWDGHGALVMRLSSEYTERTCGLCGNYNGNQGDDFLTPSGLVEILVEDFGNSWKLREDCQDLQKQDTNSCNLNPPLAKYAEGSCSILLSPLFELCHHKVNPSPYLKNCRYDVCSCSDGKDCLCAAISAYAMACARKEVLINWRQPDFCAFSCPEGQIYQQCGSPCNQTCRSLSYPDTNCNEFCMEGCYCPVGLFLDQQEDCVQRSQCSCYYDGEIFQPDDVFSDHHTMCYCENGFMHCSSNRRPEAFLPDVLFQRHSSARAKRSLACKHPMTMFVCPTNDPRAEGVECMKTCQTYELGCVSHGCISGCLCPIGWVRHGNKCTVPEKCPCFHKGQEYAPGETVTKDCNTCVCRARKWECTENVCDGSCSVIGTTHYLTFDGLKYRFPGNCQYVLVQDYCDNDNSGTFRILIANEGCSFTGERCTKRITILFDSGEIELYNGDVNILTSPREEFNFEVLKSGRYYILLLDRGGIALTWDQDMGITVILKENYKDQICGLCGNFDGIQNNDLTTSKNQLEVDPNDFGNSWKVNSQCADVTKGQGLVSSLCNGNVVKQVMVETSCSVLNSDVFKECKKMVDPEPYVDICMYDTCACESVGDCACFCDVLAAYAHACAQKGAVVHWRSRTLCSQSCEDMNKELGYQCEWRYSSCGPACPRTCQHFEPVVCPVKCVEGCHVHCPEGQILDELSESCVELEECPVCELEDLRIPHGKRIILNTEDAQLCRSCHCEGRNLTCHTCDSEVTGEILMATTIAPEDQVTREYSCSKMMDLAFLIDGSNKFSESDFEQLKAFIISMMEKLHISQKRIRLSILEYRTGSHIYLGLKDIKKPSQMRRIVQNIKYTGGDVASATEVLKYVVFHVFGKAPRTNAARIAVLLTASKDPKRIQTIFPLLKKKQITVIPVGIGPHISIDQIELIERQSLENKAFIMNSVLELRERRDEIINYFCGLVPEVSAILFTTQPPIATLPSVTVVHGLDEALTKAVRTQFSVSVHKTIDIIFLLEGSDKVGEENFNLVKEFIARTIREMDIGEETIHVSIIQYSFTITMEYSFSEGQSKEDLIKKVGEIKFHGGNATNTGKALNFVSEQTLATSSRRGHVPHLVYMVTANPATDTITRLPTDINLIPVGITPNVNIQELKQLSQPHAPIILEGYNRLVQEGPDLVLKTCCLREGTCSKPMDVIFLLDGSSNVSKSHFEEMKHFVTAFIEHTNVGRTTTQVAVLQYGKASTLEISWNVLQEKANLLSMVSSIDQREQGPSKLGEVIDFTVQHAISEVNGGRPNASKVAVIIVSDASQDSVDTAAYSARVNRVSLLPIGVGDRYKEAELRTLAGSSAPDRIIKLQWFDDLPTIAALDDKFVRKLCTETAQECIDEDGNAKTPGDKWTLLDQCHTVTCLPGGRTVLESHRINCEKMPKPTCRNSLPAVKMEETCGCRWVCPCTCMGSSTRHIVTFDGLDFKLTGNCSYTLFEDKKHDIEVVLHNGPCSSTVRLNCMNAMEVIYNGSSVLLSSNMMVAVNGKATYVPYADDHVEVNIYGAIMHEIRFSHLGHILSFTPSNNEFTLQLSPKHFASKTYGLCGTCDQNSGNDLVLKNGSFTPNSSTFIEEWTVKQPGEVCEVNRADRCAEHASTKCSILLSPQFYECHQNIPPNMFYAACEENNCYSDEICEIVSSYAHLCRTQGICVDWRSPEFCAMKCPISLMYDHCQKGCTKYCENGTSTDICIDYPTEGCFCPQGQVTLDGKCVHEEVCTQCISEDGMRHQHLETWIPSNEPCKICVCLDNRSINCTIQPCPTAKPALCGPCEIPRLRKDSDQCCPVYECVCDLVSCKMPPVPHCEDGLQLLQTNPGKCRPDYACVCKKEDCNPQSILSCPPHRKLTVKKTQCCDEYQCTCSCVNSTVACPTGYLSASLTNDCGCTSTNCIPDKVCIHQNVVYPIGKTWEEGCTECTCTDMEDAVTGLRITECLEKECSKICPPGYKYVNKEGACCGKCLKAMCDEAFHWPQGDEDVHWHKVGSEWQLPSNPCIIRECVRVNEEVFIQTKNISCTQMEPPSCPFGTELHCNQKTDCCPSCRCKPVSGCVLNGTIFEPGKHVLLDQCTSCHCNLQRGLYLKYRLTCGKITCEPCPKNYRMEKVSGSCCGKCLPTVCAIQLRNRTILYLKPNETIQDGCDSHSCKVNAKGDFIWEKRITGCPPFDANKCLSEGGKITKIENTCCKTCVEPECKQITGRLEYVKVDDCVNESQLNIHYCEGKCTSKAVYNITVNRIEDQCTCCSATATDSMHVPLRCANGSIVQHEVFSAKQCDCLSRKCKP